MIFDNFYNKLSEHGVRLTRDEFSELEERHLNVVNAVSLQLLKETDVAPWAGRTLSEKFHFAHWDAECWAANKTQMLAALLYAIDHYRRYPTEVVDMEDGGIKLLKGGQDYLHVGPLVCGEAGAGVRSRAESVLRNLLKGQEGTLNKRFSELPGMAELVPREQDYSVNMGLVWVTPNSVALGWKMLLESKKVRIVLNRAQEDVAKVLGFPSWQHLMAKWKSLPVHSPFVLRNLSNQTVTFYPDEPAALAAFSTELNGLKHLTQSMRLTSRAGGSFSLTGWGFYTGTRINVMFSVAEKVRREEEYERHVSSLVNLKGQELADALAGLLKCGSPVKEQLAASDRRKRLENAIEVQGYRFSIQPNVNAYTELRIEALKGDGWLDPERMNNVGGLRNGPWSGYLYKTDIDVHLDRVKILYDYGDQTILTLDSLSEADEQKIRALVTRTEVAP